MAGNTVISVKHVSKRFLLPHERKQSVKSAFTAMFRKSDNTVEMQQALKDISFEIKEGEFFGIVGRNGSGKSTLLKILAGIYQPTDGSIQTKGKLVPFIELGVGFNPELTGRENVYLNGAMLGFSDKEIDAMYDNIVEFAELERFMDQKLKNYSSGMQVRLAFSMATRSEADILLVDEVLAVGDADFQRKCFRYFKELKKQAKTVVFVSHDMSAVREYCDRGLLIEKSEILRQGRIDEVAGAYTKLFMEDSSIAKDDSEGRVNRKRWGNGKITYTDVDISPQNITNHTKEITIKLAFKEKAAAQNPVFGFLIKNSAGTVMCGTNTKLLGSVDVLNELAVKNEITWTIPNIFNDGEYGIDVAVSNHEETDQYDWWEDAKTFSVKRENHTPYAVEPAIHFNKKAV